MRKIYSFYMLCSLLLLSACDSYLDIQPVGSVIPTTAKEYRALLARAYSQVPVERAKACFRSDEMQVTDNYRDQMDYADLERWNDYAPSENTIPFTWMPYYNTIFIANHVIENQHQITEGTDDVIRQLAGEAYLLRAYQHFILVNMFGQPYTKAGAPGTRSVPLKLNNDLEVVLSRNTVGEVYTSILADIDRARELINKESWEVVMSYRFTTLSVDAFLSRVALYQGDWQSAYEAAEAVLVRKSTLEDLNQAAPTLPNHFKSVENITALEKMASNVNSAALAPSSFLSFYAPGDRRLSLYFSAPDEKGAGKCLKAGSADFSSTFRVGEIYLTSAEAAAQLNQLPQAKARLLQLMQKRYTPEAYALKVTAVNAMSQAALLTEILAERARELAFEGHRWFDLRRTTRPRLEKMLSGKSYVLEQDDARYTLLIPKEAIAANPELAN